MTTSSTPVRIVEETPVYWRVLFDNPPLNVVDGSVFEGLQELLSRMDASPDQVPYVVEHLQIDPRPRPRCGQRVRPCL